MFETFKDFFQNYAGFGDTQDSREKVSSVELAAAVLMVEISMADSVLQHEERRVIENALEKNFNMAETEARSLIELAEKEVDHAVSLYEFTSFLNDSMSNEERAMIVELLWQVAFADTVLDKYEEYYVRKIADLLYVPHRDFIKAKLKASEDCQIED